MTRCQLFIHWDLSPAFILFYFLYGGMCVYLWVHGCTHMCCVWRPKVNLSHLPSGTFHHEVLIVGCLCSAIWPVNPEIWDYKQAPPPYALFKKICLYLEIKSSCLHGHLFTHWASSLPSSLLQFFSSFSSLLYLLLTFLSVVHARSVFKFMCLCIHIPRPEQDIKWLSLMFSALFRWDQVSD